MYLKYFGMRELPFRLSPDTSFFFSYESHNEALNVLFVALRSGEGFIKIVGEVGTGKTLLCRKLLNTVGEEFVTAYIPNPFLTPAALRMALADELGIVYPRNIGQHRLLKLITEKLIEHTANGKRVVLCLDEAQAMPEETLEALRLLTNLETEKTKLLQIVLFGQPELDVMLNKPSVRQLKQRIVFSYRLKPIDKQGLKSYMAHRLLVAGYSGHPLFLSGAISELYKTSRGIPRLINILSHKALMVAYGCGMKTVNRQHMRSAVKDTEGVQLPPSEKTFTAVFSALSVVALAAGAGLYFYWRMQQ